MKLYHPTLKDITVDIADADEDRWRAAGWRKTEPDSTEHLEPATQTPAKQSKKKK